MNDNCVLIAIDAEKKECCSNNENPIYWWIDNPVDVFYSHSSNYTSRTTSTIANRSYLRLLKASPEYLKGTFLVLIVPTHSPHTKTIFSVNLPKTPLHPLYVQNVYWIHLMEFLLILFLHIEQGHFLEGTCELSSSLLTKLTPKALRCQALLLHLKVSSRSLVQRSSQGWQVLNSSVNVKRTEVNKRGLSCVSW